MKKPFRACFIKTKNHDVIEGGGEGKKKSTTGSGQQQTAFLSNSHSTDTIPFSNRRKQTNK